MKFFSPQAEKETVMKKSWMFLLTLIALALVALVAMNARASDDENQLIQLERAWNQAEAGANPAAIVSLFEKTLVYVDYDGSLMSKAEYLRSVRNPCPSPKLQPALKSARYGNVL